MKSGKRLRYIVIMIIVMLVGCKKKEPDFDGHPAKKLYKEGYLKIRYSESENDIDDDSSVVCRISVDVFKDMNEEQMLEVARFEELELMSLYDSGGNYIGERDGDFEAYLIFYREETDEVIDRIKYVNGERVEITEEDEQYHNFLPPYFRQHLDLKKEE